jgi:hypothetical protein
MEYTLYRIWARNVDHDRVVMHMTDMNGMYMDRFWDFGAVSVFDVARILGVWEERTFKTESISRTEFIKKFGRKVVAL